MSESKEQSNKNEAANNERELDKNKTVEDPAANVVDYGRSEQKAANQQANSKESDQKAGEDRENDQA